MSKSKLPPDEKLLFGKAFFKRLKEDREILIDTDSSDLPAEGLFARFHPDGGLKEFGFAKNGKPHGWTLQISEDGITSRSHRAQLYQFPEDAWLDPESYAAESVGEWIGRWIEDIVEDAKTIIRCSFCGKSQDTTNVMLSGKNDTYICDECVLAMTEIVESRLRESEGNPPPINA